MKRMTLHVAATAVGAALLVAAGTAVATADDEYGTGDVDVTVDIAEIEEPGVLALTVADGVVALAEDGSDELTRQFVGTLPTVTVTDTRTADEIPEDASWYVLGSSTDFVGTGGQDPVSATHLGWAPRLVDYEGGGEVFAGEPVEGSEDGGPGLVDQELLAGAFSSGAVVGEGSWTATADLALRVPSDIVPGSYTSTLTLSLFE